MFARVFLVAILVLLALSAPVSASVKNLGFDREDPYAFILRSFLGEGEPDEFLLPLGPIGNLSLEKEEVTQARFEALDAALQVQERAGIKLDVEDVTRRNYLFLKLSAKRLKEEIQELKSQAEHSKIAMATSTLKSSRALYVKFATIEFLKVVKEGKGTLYRYPNLTMLLAALEPTNARREEFLDPEIAKTSKILPVKNLDQMIGMDPHERRLQTLAAKMVSGEKKPWHAYEEFREIFAVRPNYKPLSGKASRYFRFLQASIVDSRHRHSLIKYDAKKVAVLEKIPEGLTNLVRANDIRNKALDPHAFQTQLPGSNTCSGNAIVNHWKIHHGIELPLEANFKRLGGVTDKGAPPMEQAFKSLQEAGGLIDKDGKNIPISYAMYRVRSKIENSHLVPVIEPKAGAKEEKKDENSPDELAKQKALSTILRELRKGIPNANGPQMFQALEAFNTKAAAKPDIRLFGVGFRVVTEVTHQAASPSELLEMLTHMEAILGGAKGTILANVDTDIESVEEDWLHFVPTYFRNGIGHSVVVVNYGMGINPETLQEVPYLVIEDSLQRGKVPVRFRVSVADFLEHVEEIGLITAK